MEKKVQGLLPFKVGQLAESRSFQPGFRSAWFRCKIKDISLRKGKIEHALEFFDFPDEKIEWTRIYEVPPTSGGKATKIKKMLMVRPQYPPVCHESQIPCANTISEVTVVNNGVWKVGDLVDWWTDGCYWSGRVTQILGNDKVQIELPPPPVGEGSSYEVLCKHLRPSLDWSPEHGWSVPTSKEGEENCLPCARLIKPVDQAVLPNLEIDTEDVGIPNGEATAGSMRNASFPPLISANSLPPVDESKQSIAKENPRQPLSIAIPNRGTHRREPKKDLDMGDSAIGKAGLSQRIGKVEDASAGTAGNHSGEDQYYRSGSSKNMKTGGSISLNSMCSDTIEAPIIDLEELLSKVKWIKGILESGVPPSNARRPPWKFVEHCASSTPK